VTAKPAATALTAAPAKTQVPNLPKKAAAPAALPKPVASNKNTAAGGADDEWEAF